MKKELQDLVWSVLPKEFKEGVKGQYNLLCQFNNVANAPAKDELEYLFGPHNLISDAEEDEMLTVSRKRVQELYEAMKSEQKCTDVYNQISAEDRAAMLYALFGSKCLPDEAKDDTKGGAMERNVDTLEPNVDSSEPTKLRFKVGDKVRMVSPKRYKGCVAEIIYVDENDPYAPYKVDIYDEQFGGGIWCAASQIEPYTEPADHIADNGKMVDRRLNIATTILGNLIKSQYYSLSYRYQEDNIKEMAKVSARLTDAIIGELNESAVHKHTTFRQTMNYDITFCEGEGCQRREQCHRYRELLRFRADTDPNRKDYISMTRPNDPDKCTIFWREKGTEQ